MSITEILRYGLLIGLAICAYLLVQAWNEDYGRGTSTTLIEDAPLSSRDFDDADVSTPISAPDETNEEVQVRISSDAQQPQTMVPDSSLLRENTVATPAIDFSDDSTLIEVVTPLLHVWIDRLGGDIVRVQLPKHPVSLEQPDVPLTLLNRSRNRIYIAQSGFIGRDGLDRADGRPLYSTVRNEWELTEGTLDVVLKATVDGIELEKHFEFSADEYLIHLRQVIHNNRAEPFRANVYAQLVHDGNPLGDEPTFLGPRPYLGAALTTNESRYDKISFSDIDESRFDEEVNGGWMALLQHYFLSAWVVNDKASYLYFGIRGDEGNYRFGLTGPEVQVGPGQSGEFPLRFYAGPKDQQALSDIAENLNLTVDYGFLWWLSLPLFYCLELAYLAVGNWGVAIILLTVFIKVILYPLSAMSYKSMARMRTVSPKMKRLQERFAGDRQRMSQELMALYKKENVNPMLGCLPMLAQMPVFLALYWVLYESVELRQAPFFLWINDLSVMDPWFILPILMGASMYLMQMLNPPMPDPMQQKMMKIMPFVFTALFVFFPAGLVLYWLANNLLSFAQQWFTTRQIEKEAAAKNT